MTAPINPNQLITQAATYAMTVSIFASAVGILIAAVGVEAIPAGVVGAPAVLKGIKDLQSAFGTALVNTAIDNVGTTDIVALAAEVERLYIGQMKRKYGEWETKQALEVAPAGDIRAANEIALVLKSRGITPASPSTMKYEAVETGKKRGKKVAQPVKDTKTGIVYGSKARAGMAVAAEYGLDPKNHFVWYEILKLDPKRFVRV